LAAVSTATMSQVKFGAATATAAAAKTAVLPPLKQALTILTEALLAVGKCGSEFVGCRLSEWWNVV